MSKATQRGWRDWSASSSSASSVRHHRRRPIMHRIEPEAEKVWTGRQGLEQCHGNTGSLHTCSICGSSSYRSYWCSPSNHVSWWGTATRPVRSQLVQLGRTSDVFRIAPLQQLIWDYLDQTPVSSAFTDKIVADRRSAMIQWQVRLNRLAIPAQPHDELESDHDVSCLLQHLVQYAQIVFKRSHVHNLLCSPCTQFSSYD